MNSFFLFIQDTLDVNEAEMWYLLCLIAAMPLCLFYRYVRKETLRLLYGLMIGVIFTVLVFGNETFHLLVMMSVTYALMRFLPSAWKPHYVSFVFNMMYLMAGHIDTVWNHWLEFALNWTAAGMMLTIKLTSAAYEHYDGIRPKSELATLHKDMQERAFSEVPSLLQWFSYCFFFPTVLVGPPVGLRDYLSFCDYSMFKDEPEGQIPSAWTFGCLGKSFALIAMALTWHFLHASFPVTYTVTDEFLEHGLVYRVLYLTFSADLSFEHYYFGWFSAEAATCIAGISFNGRDKDGNVSWERCRMIGFVDFRLGNDGTVISRNWNVQGAKWLRHTVYYRLVNRDSSTAQKSIAQIVTYAVSACWHGFYPGFYLSFFSFAYVTIVSRVIRANLRHFFYYKDPDNPRAKEVPRAYYQLYEFASWIACQFSFYYCALPFKTMTVPRTLKAWGSIYYFYHVVAALIWVFFVATGSFWRSYKPKRKGKKDQ